MWACQVPSGWCHLLARAEGGHGATAKQQLCSPARSLNIQSRTRNSSIIRENRNIILGSRLVSLPRGWNRFNVTPASDASHSYVVFDVGLYNVSQTITIWTIWTVYANAAGMISIVITLHLQNLMMEHLMDKT